MPNNEVSINSTLNIGKKYIKIHSFEPDGGDGYLEFLSIYCLKCDKLFTCSHSYNKKIDYHFNKSTEHKRNFVKINDTCMYDKSDPKDTFLHFLKSYVFETQIHSKKDSTNDYQYGIMTLYNNFKYSIQNIDDTYLITYNNKIYDIKGVDNWMS